MNSEDLRAILSKGPTVGKELYIETGAEIFDLWYVSNLDYKVVRVGNRYLRFDKNVEGYARLSPAIEREFMTYSVIGLDEDIDAINREAESLEQSIKAISSRKMRLAEEKVRKAARNIELEGVCCIIGGDVPLGMAHDDPRPEKSTGKLVAGSDLDVVAILSDDVAENTLIELDEMLYKEKYSLLKNPHRKEELDYLVKRFSKVVEQARFDTIESMIACKIVNESKLLYGDAGLYKSVLQVLYENGVPTKLEEMERIASKRRENAEKYLLKKGHLDREDHVKLFTTSDEFGEIF